MAWHLSGFPADIYVKGRFRALTNELNRFHAGLEEQTGQIELAVNDMKKAVGEAREKVRIRATEFLATRLHGSILGRAGVMGSSQAETFLALAGADAKKTEEFKNWDEAQKKVEAAGKRYEKAYQELQTLLTAEMWT